ncbi:MAG: YbhN family protein [Candidatus Hodarchaeota archaeon]
MAEIPSETITLKKFFDPKTILFVIIAFSGMIFYFALTTQKTGGVGSIISALLTAVPVFILAGVIINFCALGLDVVSWRLILSTSGIRPPFLRLCNVYLTSFVFGLLIPSAGAVEIGIRTSMGREFYNYKEDRNATSGEILSSIALHRLLGTLAFIPLSVVVAAGFVVLLEAYVPPVMGILFVLLITAFAIFLASLVFSVYFKPNAVIRFFGALPLLRNYPSTIEKLVNDYNNSLGYLGKYKTRAALAFLCTLTTALISYIGGALVIYSIDSEIPFLVVAVVIFLSGFLNLIPIPIPGMEGLREISVSWLFEVYKPGHPDKAAAASILMSLTSFYAVVTVGLIVYLVTRRSFLKQELLETKEKEISHAVETPTKTNLQ